MRRVIIVGLTVGLLVMGLYAAAQTISSAHWLQLAEIAAPLQYKKVADDGSTRAIYFRDDRSGYCFRVEGRDFQDFFNDAPTDWGEFWPYAASKYTADARLPADFFEHCDPALWLVKPAFFGRDTRPTYWATQGVGGWVRGSRSKYRVAATKSAPVQCDPVINLADRNSHHMLDENASVIDRNTGETFVHAAIASEQQRWLYAVCRLAD